MSDFPQDIYAMGVASADATEFKLLASSNSKSFGICSVPFLEHAFRTIEFSMSVTLHGDGTWSYEEDTVLMIAGNPEPFHHRDRNTLVKLEEPQPNPMAR